MQKKKTLNRREEIRKLEDAVAKEQAILSKMETTYAQKHQAQTEKIAAMESRLRELREKDLADILQTLGNERYSYDALLTLLGIPTDADPPAEEPCAEPSQSEEEPS